MQDDDDSPVSTPTDIGRTLGRALVEHGLDDRHAARLAMVANAVFAGGQAARITALKANPGRLIDLSAESGPQRVADAKSRDRREAMVVASEDMELLIETLARAVEPRFASGRELCARFAHDRPATRAALAPPDEAAHVTPTLAEALHGRRAGAGQGAGVE
ncbi:hypothetical protein NHN26_14195 [Rhodovulum tesquicola]|uniref:hypothetical protein n=1 Tax=Rhodovulum tesquicola TaxID=540254 RepID=UPI002097333E|nr:hypothetical protein [Rhodovulum tesquicola]MCO8146376.1 hypothetical protein [Rhodovulum tesquicola]